MFPHLNDFFIFKMFKNNPINVKPNDLCICTNIEMFNEVTCEAKLIVKKNVYQPFLSNVFVSYIYLILKKERERESEFPITRQTYNLLARTYIYSG